MKSPDEILAQAAETFRSRNKTYGNNFLAIGPVMQALFPNGIELKTERDHVRFHMFSMIATKLSRYTKNFFEPHQDSIHDLVVYGAMLEAIDGDEK